MKVLLAIESLGAGGTERSQAELLPRLRELGVETTVACLFRRSGALEDVLRAGFTVHQLDGGWLRRLAALRRLLRSERPDLVHTVLFRTDVLGRLAAAGTGIPVLTSLVNTRYAPARMANPAVRRPRQAVVRKIDSWTARALSDGFHAVSRAVKDDAVRALRLAPERVVVIERGRDPRRLGEPGPDRTERARRALGLGPHHRVLVNVGRHVFAKDQLGLVRAVERLRDRVPDLVLLIAGDRGPLTAELEAAIAGGGLAERVRLLGHRDDLPEILAAADLFVFPSRYEGLPGALIEAMALGLPVVAADNPAVREVVVEGEHAVLVPPADPEALATAVRRLLDDPARGRAMGRANRARFLERYTLERSVTAMRDLYERLASGGNGP